MKYVFLLATTILLTTGCSKKEIKTDSHNVKYENIQKKDFSQTTEEYKKTKANDNIEI